MCTMLIMYCKHLFGITSVDIVQIHIYIFDLNIHHKQVLVRYQMGQIHKGVSLKHSHEKITFTWKWVKFTLKLCKPTYEKILVFKKCLPYTRLDVIENIHFLLDLSNTNPDFLINYFTKSSSLRKHSKDKEAVLVH